MSEPLINPIIYYGPGVCPDCLVNMVLADTETNVIELDENGVGKDIVYSAYKCNAICPKCRKQFPMMRSNGIYKPYSRIGKLIDDLEFEEALKDRLKKDKGTRYNGDLVENPLIK